MEDEKELIVKIKNSFKKGMSRAEITGRLQEQGYKLEYIDALIRKAKRPKKILFSLFAITLILVSYVAVTFFLFSSQEKKIIENPLQQMKSLTSPIENLTEDANKSLNYDEIEITPEFISYLLNEIGGWQLHKNPLTQEKPVMNFKISDRSFYSVVSNGKITTLEGTANKADLEFLTLKKDIIDAMLDENPEQVFRQSVKSGNTQINMTASQSDLFAKGYLNLYNNLKG